MSRKVNNLRKRIWMLEQRLASNERSLKATSQNYLELSQKLRESKQRECPPLTRAVIIDVENQDPMRRGMPIYRVCVSFSPDSFLVGIDRSSRGQLHNASQEAYYLGQQLGRQVSDAIMQRMTGDLMRTRA